MNSKTARVAVSRVTDAALIGGAVMGVWEPLVIRIAVENGYRKVQRYRARTNQAPDTLYINDTANGDNGLRTSEGKLYGHLVNDEIVLLDGTKVPVEPVA